MHLTVNTGGVNDIYMADQLVEKTNKKVLFDLPQLPSRHMKSIPLHTEQGTGKISASQIDFANHFRTQSSTKIESTTEKNLVFVSHVSCVSPMSPDKIESNDDTEQYICNDRHTYESDCIITPSVPQTYRNDEQSTFEQTNSKRTKHRHEEETRFSDIIGHASVKLRIDELILPLGLPPIIADSVLKGIRSIPTSILLYGPPGCGKTKLARAIAGESRAAYIGVAPSDVLSKFVGESEASIRKVFCKAVREALHVESKAVVIFFDEIDALGQSRDICSTGEGEGCSRRVLSELLLLLNVVADNRLCSVEDFTSLHSGSHDDANHEIKDNEIEDHASKEAAAHVIVVAATNRIEDCDPALLRRFGIQLEVKLPSLKDRKKMILSHLHDIAHSITEHEINHIAIMTENWSGSTLENLAREACMCPVRECLRKAAKLRRRNVKLGEQYSGDTSGQMDHPISPDIIANTCLLDSFQHLRSVTYEDFRRAMCTLTGTDVSTISIMPTTTTYDINCNKAHKSNHCIEEHYDSSSDDEN